MSIQDEILEVLKRGGPQVAPKIAREVKGDALIISAYLSELASSSKLKISQMKIGTSPLYYLPGQEKRLTLFADRLNSKDRGVFDKLEQLKVLREAQLDLLGKVALRKMKDFAIPLQVTVGGKKEIFWRWYMLEPAETNLIVSSLLQQVGPSDAVEEVTSAGLSTPAVPQSQNQRQPLEQSSRMNQRVPTASELANAAKVATNTASNQTGSQSSLQQASSTVRETLGLDYPPNTTVKGTAQVDSVYPHNTADISKSNSIYEDTIQGQVVEVINTVDIDSMNSSEVLFEDDYEDDTRQVAQQELIDKEVEDKIMQEQASKKAKELQQKEAEAKEAKEVAEKELAAADFKRKEALQKEKQVTMRKLEEEQAAKEELILIEKQALEDPEKQVQLIVKKEITAFEPELFAEEDSKLAPVEEQKSLVEKLKDTFLPKHKGKPGELLPKVEDFLNAQDIFIESSEVVRKNSDLILQILVPTKVGKVLFFCKVRNKKRCDEKDISAAYMEAQVAKLPLLFLYTDEVSQKAKDFLDSGSFDNLLLMKLDVDDK